MLNVTCSFHSAILLFYFIFAAYLLIKSVLSLRFQLRKRKQYLFVSF